MTTARRTRQGKRPPTFTQFLTRTLGIRSLSRAQLVFCRVAFDGVDPVRLDPADRELAEAMFGAVDTVPPAARRVLVALKGARSSFPGSWGCSLHLLYLGLVADLSSLALGEHGYGVVVAPDLRLARQCMRYIVGAVESCAELRGLVVSSGSDSLTLRRPDGAVITFECLPASRGGTATRGRTMFGALLDEASFFRDPESGVVNDAEVFSSINPRLTIPGSMMMVISTAWLESGLLFDLHSRHHGDPTTVLAATCPTLIMRDDLAIRAVVEAETERDPDNAAREFGCQTMPGGAGEFFSTSLLQQCIDRDVSSCGGPPIGVRAGVGADLAQVRDATAFSAVHRDRGGQMYSAELFELRPERGKVLQLSHIVPQGCAFARRHRQQMVWADHHLASAAREWLPRGFQWRTVPGGNAFKAQRWLLARELLRERRLIIPGDQRRLIRQLSEVVAKPMSGGGLQIVQPRRGGVHGDQAAAFVVAVWAARKGTARLFSSVANMTPEKRREMTKSIDRIQAEFEGRPYHDAIDVGLEIDGTRYMSNAEWSASPHKYSKRGGR